MSDPHAAGQSRRLNHQGTFARTAGDTPAGTGANTPAQGDGAAPTWTILGTWLAAVAAVVVILGLVFGYSGSDAERPSGEPATAGAPATGVAPSAPLAAPRQGDERVTAPETPADDDP